MTAPNWVHSCRWPGVRTTARGSRLASETRWILVPNPPRDFPRAWSGGSPGGGFFPPGPGRRPGRPGVGPVHAVERVVDEAGCVQPELQGGQDVGQRAGPAEVAEPVVDRLPRAVPAGQVPPRAAGPQPVEDAAEDRPVVPPLPAPAAGLGGEERGEDRPLGVGEVASVHTRSEARPPSTDSADRA